MLRRLLCLPVIVCGGFFVLHSGTFGVGEGLSVLGWFICSFL